MTDRILLGVGRRMIPVPGVLWRHLMRANGRKIRASLGFMTADHQRVRDFAVMELPRAAGPLTPEHIAASVELPITRVRTVLDELERRLTFLFRSRGTGVTWAYPVTRDETPHRAAFSTGEEAYSP